jgi:hypothetical protein
MSDEEPLDLDYQKVRRELVTLFEATANKMEREWPARYTHVDSVRVIFYQSGLQLTLTTRFFGFAQTLQKTRIENRSMRFHWRR